VSGTVCVRVFRDGVVTMRSRIREGFQDERGLLRGRRAVGADQAAQGQRRLLTRQDES
jgi:hypothetical protein